MSSRELKLEQKQLGRKTYAQEKREKVEQATAK